MTICARPLSIEEIERIAIEYKEKLTHECERMVRRHDNAAALAAIVGKEYIDEFVYRLKLRAGSQIGVPPRARPIQLNVARAGRKSKRESE